MNQSGRCRAVCVTTALLAVAVAASPAQAQKAKAVREAAEYVMERFGKEAAEETTESLASKLAQLSAKHGDEAIDAVKAVGPRAFRLVDEAGEHAPSAIKLMVKYGDNAAWVISRPNRLAIFVQHGDDAAEAMIKHKDIVLPLIERYRAPACQALKAVDGQNARRLAMLEDAGDLAKIGRTDEVLAVVGRYGDKASDFIWRNKGVLATAAALTAFLADPEPFITGTTKLVDGVGDVVKEPLREMVRGTNWTVVVLSVVGLLFVAALFRWRRFFMRGRGSSAAPERAAEAPTHASTMRHT